MGALLPGCYYKQPTASSKCGGPFTEWERDVWGEENAQSSEIEALCKARKDGHDAYCGVTTEWQFVETSSLPGSPESEGECCDDCNGAHAFCSPGSGRCYDSKAKDYYVSCTTT